MSRERKVKPSNFHLECCKEMKNYNSMFAIVSGLDHKTVQRLQTTWERIPDKYKHIFEVNQSKLIIEPLFHFD